MKLFSFLFLISATNLNAAYLDDVTYSAQVRKADVLFTNLEWIRQNIKECKEGNRGACDYLRSFFKAYIEICENRQNSKVYKNYFYMCERLAKEFNVEVDAHLIARLTE